MLPQKKDGVLNREEEREGGGTFATDKMDIALRKR